MEEKNEMKKILVALYIIIGILVVNTLLLIIVNNDKFTTFSTSGNGNNNGGNTTTTNNEEVEYDVSSFKAINGQEFIDAYKGSELKVIYIGRETCGYCVQFVPVLKQAQKELGFTPLYLDISTITSSDAEAIMGLDSYFEENFGYTPMTVLVKDNKIVAEQIGALGYDDLVSFLKENLSK